MTSDKPRSKSINSGSAALVALPFLFCLLLQACGAQGDPEHHFTGPIMGTFYNVKVVGAISEEQQQLLAEAIEKTLVNVDQKMSTWKTDSELSRFNQHHATDPFPFSRETLEVFDIARQVSEQSGGAFDVTIGPIVNTYGFGPTTQEQDLPDPQTIASLRERVGYEKLQIDLAAGTLSKMHPEIYADLSAIAKGYGVDAVAATLDGFRMEDYMVEVGGEVRTRGRNHAGKPWQIAVEKPVSGVREVERVIPLNNISMATSGDYRNFMEQDGKRISHTIDARTGQPIDHALASVTVLHRSCAWADAYATAINVLGPEEGMAFAENHKLPVLLIVHEGAAGFAEQASTAFEEYVARISQSAP